MTPRQTELLKNTIGFLRLLSLSKGEPINAYHCREFMVIEACLCEEFGISVDYPDVTDIVATNLNSEDY